MPAPSDRPATRAALAAHIRAIPLEGGPAQMRDAFLRILGPVPNVATE